MAKEIKLWTEEETLISQSVFKTLSLFFPDDISYSIISLKEIHFLHDCPAKVYVVQGTLLETIVRFSFPNSLCFKINDFYKFLFKYVNAIASKLQTTIEEKFEITILLNDYFKFLHLAEEPIWHSLKNGAEVEENIGKLLALGKGLYASRYRKLWHSGSQNEAKEYAQTIYQQFHGSSSFRLPPHRKLTFSESKNEEKPDANVLFVDDKYNWFEWLEPLTHHFNKSNDNFNIKLTYAGNPESALKMLKEENFDATVMDYYLKSNDSSLAISLTKRILEINGDDFPIFGLTGKSPSINLNEDWDTIHQDWKVDRCFYKKADEGAEPYELILTIADAVQEKFPNRKEYKRIGKINILLIGKENEKFYDSIEKFNILKTHFEYDLIGPIALCCGHPFLFRPYIHSVLIESENTQESEKAVDKLVQIIKTYRPDISYTIYKNGQYTCYNMNALDSCDIISASNSDLVLERIRDNLYSRYTTPFFTALQKYSKRPSIVFHALPLSRGKSVASSDWAHEFAEFYGEGYFAGETSTTMKPLDSLLNPSSSLKESMELAAKVFCSDITQFVTNGTTGANLIVYRTHVHPNDIVILDRNCHQSHHYAAIHCGARVVYMEPYHLDEYGVSTLVSSDTLRKTLNNFKRGQIRIISLTHPTFDGVCYDPETIMRTVHEFDPDIVLLFDEAWFAYAVLHPLTRKRSAMYISKKLFEEKLECRVYVTQSTHKTLSAMRQGSMIHIRDPKFNDQVKIAFDEAMIACTTTSPNVHILGSLDFARMQADLEGFDKLSHAFAIAHWIRTELAKEGSICVLSEKELFKGIPRESNPMLDKLKITLFSKNLSGFELKKKLNTEYKIQLNKYSHNTVLILVTIGTTWSMADHLIRSVRAINSELSNKNNKSYKDIKIPLFGNFHAKYCSTKLDRVDEYIVGDISRAYSGVLSGKLEIIKIDLREEKIINKYSNLAAATIVAPYPPGYPVLVPGQKITTECLEYLHQFVKEGVNIHGIYEGQLHCIKIAEFT